MNEALKEAKKSFDLDEVPIGAIIVKDNEIIGRGHNTKEHTNSPLNHAEMIAISNACEKIGDWRLIGCDLYVTLEPCAMCAGAILNSRISNVYIGTRDQRMGCAGTVINLLDMPTFNHKVKVEFGVLENESSSLISSFFLKLRNRK
ncbi:MAG: nucleoside deaminase [Tissierellia bacterium]|nr:nucleoside deaminase [Tissierellia bacterium]